MRAFEPYNKRFVYPEDMDIILTFLKTKGKLNISDKKVEDYYFDFSYEKYWADWMSVDTICCEGTEYEHSILEEFTEWLAEEEV